MTTPRVWSMPDDPGPHGTTVLWDQHGVRWQWRTDRHGGGWHHGDGGGFDPLWSWPELLTGRGPMTDQPPERGAP